MNKVIARAALAALATTAMIAAAPGYAFTNADRIGEPVNAVQADRTVVLTPATRWVNVGYGEAVKFEVQGEGADSFVWYFDGRANNLSLKDIDPKASRDIAIYVNQAANPMNANAGD